MVKIPLSQQELQEKLETQLRRMRDAAERYDRDRKEDDLLTLSTVIRLLCKDGPNPSTCSLLGQLGLKQPETQRYFDSSFPKKAMGIPVSISWCGLSVLPMSGKYHGTALPLLDSGPAGSQLPFEDWWEQEILYDKDRNSFSRREIVLHLAEQDGGDHVDREVNEAYYRIKNNNSMGLLAGNGKTWVPVDAIIGASVRQIAHELLRSLVAQYPEVKPDCDDAGVIIGGMELAVSPAIVVPKVGRNERCPCGSGKKYKRCHGI